MGSCITTSAKHCFTTANPYLSLLWSLFPLLLMIPEPWKEGRGIGGPFRAEHCTVFYSLYINQLFVSTTEIRFSGYGCENLSARYELFLLMVFTSEVPQQPPPPPLQVIFLDCPPQVYGKILLLKMSSLSLQVTKVSLGAEMIFISIYCFHQAGLFYVPSEACQWPDQVAEPLTVTAELCRLRHFHISL